MGKHVRFAFAVLLPLVFPYWGNTANQSPGSGGPAASVQDLYETMVAAERFPEAHAAAKKLGERGDEGLPLLTRGTTHKKERVRNVCFRVLKAKYPTEPCAVDAIVQGLTDKSNGWINVRCALHIGKHRIVRAIPDLKTVCEDKNSESIVRFAAARALAELGEKDIFPLVYNGVGSEQVYARIYSNKGLKAICGKDLTHFGYESPAEDCVLFASYVARSSGPIERAQWKAKRWQAVGGFSEWLRSNRPDLFGKLPGSERENRS